MARRTLTDHHYQGRIPSRDDIELASIIWGLSLGVSLSTSLTASKQIVKAWRRSWRVTLYMVFVGLEWCSSTIMGVISWCFLKGFIKPSVEYFVAIIILWCFQVHTLMQIITNRIAILSVSPGTAIRLKWGTFSVLTLINIAVICIWVPAQLQISERYIQINNVWDRCQKALICIVDAPLNIYFVYQVRSQLLANGLTKYTQLFNFNLFMIAVSISLDIMIVAMMSLPNKLVYVQFHPLAYLLKLQIELGMADLFIKIVRETNPHNIGSSEPYSQYSGTTAGGGTGGQTDGVNPPSPNSSRHHNTHVRVSSDKDTIKKTATTESVGFDGTHRHRAGERNDENETISESSSTGHLEANSPV